MRRVVVLGRGGAGKSTFAARLGVALSLPVVELDKHFWRPGPTPTPSQEWARIQRDLTAHDHWILDGDLGPYDVLDVRLRVADTVIVLDFPLWRCAWRALRRSRESWAFWRWVLSYRRSGLPEVLAAVAAHAGHAELHLLRTPHAADRLLHDAAG